MRQSTKILGAVALGWACFTGLCLLVLFSGWNAFWVTSHDDAIASVVWALVGLVFASGVAQFVAFHAYVRVIFGERLDG